MSTPVVSENKTFDELAIGETATLTRTLTRSDLAVFSTAAGIAFSTAAAKGNGGGEVGGTTDTGQWALAVMASVVTGRLPGPGASILAQSATFSRPVEIGDTLEARATVSGKDRDGASVRIEAQCSNQRGE